MGSIREIEHIIDHYHEKHIMLKKEKNQVLFDSLRVFEDMCRLSSITMAFLDPDSMEATLRTYMDALNMVIYWIYSECDDTDTDVSMLFSSKSYNEAFDLLSNYAIPYASICAGYIGYSRNRFTANVEDNVVDFNVNEIQSKIFCANMAESFDKRIESRSSEFSVSPIVLDELKEKIHFEDGRICYSLTSEIIYSFRQFAVMQWEKTSMLPLNWKFDSFSMDEYKNVWLSLDTMCMIHFYACIQSNMPGAALEDNVIIIEKESLIKSLASLSDVECNKVESILCYITYNSKIKNTDIMYQPLILITNKRILITPHLFMASSPERNIIAVINKNRDKTYSVEVNLLENIMLEEIESQIPKSDKMVICRQVDIGSDLPDVDFGIYDKTTNSAIICEMKWLIESDSAQEVFAREDDIEHGIQQIRDIMSYAVCNRSIFFKKLFNIEDEYIDLFYCVIAKNDIRSKSSDIPVIGEKKFIELMNTVPANSAFHKIRNREFYKKIPDNLIMSKKTIEYAGYKFNIPAIVEKNKKY